jgi:hypothetical protein
MKTLTEEDFNLQFFGSFQEETHEERLKRINYETKQPVRSKLETHSKIEETLDITDFSTARTFNKLTYKDNDTWAKEVFSAYITKKGHTIIKDDEDYSIDIITEKDGIKHYFELEVSSLTFTNREDFPYEKVSYLGRKKKYCDKATFNYIIMSRTGAATTCNSDDIFKDDQKKVVYCSKGRDGYDELYYVDKNNVKFFKIN